VFAILRFLPQYDWVYWHDADSLFLNFSRSLDSYLDDKYDMVLTAAPCSSNGGGGGGGGGGSGGAGAQVLDTGHMLIQNTKTALNTFRSVWGMWNHSHCKYDTRAQDAAAAEGRGQETPLCKPGVGSSLVPAEGGRGPPKSVPNKATYRGGDQGALMAVLSNCEVCAEKVKYTGFRTFNALWPCQRAGDLVVHLPYTPNATKKRAVAEAFLQHTNFADGTYNVSGSPAILGKQCAVAEEHACSTRKDCDKVYHGLNTHRRCPPPAAAAAAAAAAHHPKPKPGEVGAAAAKKQKRGPGGGDGIDGSKHHPHHGGGHPGKKKKQGGGGGGGGGGAEDNSEGEGGEHHRRYRHRGGGPPPETTTG
jgi:ribosomal protein L37AE/L43A